MLTTDSGYLFNVCFVLFIAGTKVTLFVNHDRLTDVSKDAKNNRFVGFNRLIGAPFISAYRLVFLGLCR